MAADSHRTNRVKEHLFQLPVEMMSVQGTGVSRTRSKFLGDTRIYTAPRSSNKSAMLIASMN